jgi:hypothetical protein
MATGGAEPVPFGRRFRRAMRSGRFPIACVIFAVGAFLSVLALGFFTPLSADSPFTWFNGVTNSSVGNFNLLFVVLGPILAIVGAYFMGAYLVASVPFGRPSPSVEGRSERTRLT